MLHFSPSLDDLCLFQLPNPFHAIFFSFSLFYAHTHINRKVADVRREKELAERRKNEPQLGTSQDHLVRKIFSKFRRAQQTAQLTKDSSQNSDVEKGADTDQESKKVRI
jgi:hypothetical protein